MTYKGIDYSLGRSNFNPETGIHFGVISQNSVMAEAWADAEPDYGDPHCPKCGGDVVEYDRHNEAHSADDVEEGNGCADYFCAGCKYVFDSSEAFPDEALGFSYERDGYKLTDCLDSDIMVLDSRYYTFTQYCSPCCPGAGNLDNYVEGGVKTYALGYDWFEDDKAPYPVYEIATDKEVSHD